MRPFGAPPYSAGQGRSRSWHRAARSGTNTHPYVVQTWCTSTLALLEPDSTMAEVEEGIADGRYILSASNKAI